MKKQIAYGVAVIAGVSLVGAQARTLASAQDAASQPATVPVVFQAAGPTAASIQSMIDAFRAALGGGNNGNAPGPLAGGRREINWDGGGSTTTSLVPTPFNGFVVNRGARFTTPGTGFVQAPVEGLAQTFGNPTFATIFQAFSPVRLFSAVGSNLTDTRFFVPGGGEIPATTAGFGAIFSDVDVQPGNRKSATTLSFLGADGTVLYTAAVPAVPGDATFSFVGVLFDEAVVARVRIQAGRAAPGPSAKHDVVMMDDFIYGEPQVIVDPLALHAIYGAERESR